MKKFLQLFLNIIFLALIIYNVIDSNGYDYFYVFFVLLGFFILNVLLNKWRKLHFEYHEIVMWYILLGGIIFLIGIYSIGFISGFEKNLSTIYGGYLKSEVWITRFGIVLLTELVRYVIFNAPRLKKSIIYYLSDFILVTAFVFVELTLKSRTYDLTVYDDLYEFFSLILIQSYAKNIFLIYCVKRGGYGPCIVYRFIMDLYVYFIPLAPDINIFIEAVILLGYPYVLYMFIKKDLGEFNYDDKIVKKSKIPKFVTVISDVFFFSIIGIMVALVSREFTYCAIAIGSESMTGVFNKGDAIVYKVYDSKNDNLKEGDIIVFVQSGTTIIHRIIEISYVDGSPVYQTKGDFNESKDSWVVKPDAIKGIYQGKVMLIGWPSVLLSEVFYH